MGQQLLNTPHNSPESCLFIKNIARLLKVNFVIHFRHLEKFLLKILQQMHRLKKITPISEDLTLQKIGVGILYIFM